MQTNNGNSLNGPYFLWDVQKKKEKNKKKGTLTTPPVSTVAARVAFHHPSVGRERVWTDRAAFICAAFPFRVMRPAKVSQVLVI